MQYNLSFELTSFALLSFICVKFFLSPKFPDKKNMHFGIYITMAWAAIAFNLIGCYTLKYANSIPVWMNVLINEMVFILQFLMVFFLTNYVLILCGLWTKTNMPYLLIHVSLGIVFLCFIIFNSITGWLFYFDSNMMYFHGPSYELYFIPFCLYLVFDSILSVINRKKLDLLEYLMIPFLSLMVFLCMVMQYMFPSFLFTGFAITIGTMLLFLDIQNPNNELDPLTKAYSRERMTRYTQELISSSRNACLLYVDIYGMGMFNKSFGEENGNLLLIKVVKLLKTLNPNSLVFRYSGDSFVLILPSLKALDEAKAKLYNILDSGFDLGFVSIKLQLKLIAYTALDKETSSESLNRTLELAIKAMGEKQLNIVEYVSEDLVAKSHKSQEVEKALRIALQSDAIEAYLQPVIDTKTSTIVAAEALARIEDSMMGLLKPSEFIPVAEETGLIGQLGLQIIEKVCRFLSRSNTDLQWISINLTVADYMDPGLGERIISILNRYDIDPSRIVLEVTETMAMLEESLPDNLRTLSRLGFKLAIDDFGTEYANMGSVLKLPFTFVKLDKSVVRLQSNIDRRRIISKMVEAFNDLGLSTVVEGIETPEMAQIAKETGVRYMQGFYFSVPLEVPAFLRYLETRRPNEV